MAKGKSSVRTVTGLELDPGYVAAASVHVNGEVAVQEAGFELLGPNVLREGRVTDPAALTSALKELFGRTGLPKKVRIGVADQSVVVREIELPPLEDPRALAAAVRVQAPDHLPMPLEEVVLDFHDLGQVETPNGKRTKVLLVAARKDAMTQAATACRDAGLKVEGIDLSAFAMVRGLSRKPGPLDKPDDGATAYVAVSGVTNLAVAVGRECRFTRTAPGGIEALAIDLAERRSLTLEHARMWLKHVGLVAPLDEVPGERDIVPVAREVLEQGVRALAGTLRGSLGLWRQHEGAAPVTKGVLCGPGAAVPGLAGELSLQLGIPFSTARPAGELADEAADRVAVAAGLAVESV